MVRRLRDGELQNFVDGLITRSPGVQDEVRRIARVTKHRKYIRERASRAATVHKKRRVRKKVTKEATAARIESKRKKGIARHGVCETCGEKHIAGGDSVVSQRAGLAQQCQLCYNLAHGRKSSHERGGAEITSKLVLENGLCPKCEAHAIAGGVSEVSVLAREDGLCLYCYRASRTKKKIGTPRKKICGKCCVARVASGRSLLAVVARRKGLCLDCHRFVDGETEE